MQRTSIPNGKRHTMESRTMWLKNERRRNAALDLAWTTTPGENAVSQSWSQQPSHTKIGETLNNHLNQELAHSQCTNLLLHDKNHLQKSTYYDEKDHRKSGNYPIQKCHNRAKVATQPPDVRRLTTWGTLKSTCQLNTTLLLNTTLWLTI